MGLKTNNSKGFYIPYGWKSKSLLQKYIKVLSENYVGEFAIAIYFTTKVLGQASDTLSKLICQFLSLSIFIMDFMSLVLKRISENSGCLKRGVGR